LRRNSSLRDGNCRCRSNLGILLDQPDVEASKIAMRTMTEVFEKTGALPEALVFADAGSLTPMHRMQTACASAGADQPGAGPRRIARRAAGDYIALSRISDAFETRVQALQNAPAFATERGSRPARTGPRFLHSTDRPTRAPEQRLSFFTTARQPACRRPRYRRAVKASRMRRKAPRFAAIFVSLIGLPRAVRTHRA
jgi:hypothetical protein